MPLPSPDKLNFLIVDDMDNMRRSIRAMLKLINFGKEHFEAANGKDAWNLLQSGESKVHFIISDWNMPKMNGTELLNNVRASRKYRDTPFLMVTAEANKEVVADAAENEVDAYLTKPFVTASLEQKINSLLEHANNPDPLTMYLITSRDLEEKGDIDGAIAETVKAVNLNKRTSRPMREMGRLHLKKEELKKALGFFEQAIEINRLDVTSYHYIGQIFYRMGKVDKAIEAFSRAMDINPRHSDRALKFANLLLKKKKLKEAEKILATVLRFCDNNLDLKEDVGELCNDYGLYAISIKAFRELLRDDPERIYLNKKLGIALSRSGQTKEALAILEKALDKFGDDVELLLELSKAYFSINMLVRADKWATQVIRLDPDNLEAKEILEKCL